MMEVSVIVPTLDEEDNIVPLLARLDCVMVGVVWELIFVDDNSQDGTVNLIKARMAVDPKTRLVQRLNRTGLASASITGMENASGIYLLMMDADGQHDEKVVGSMIEEVRNGADLVVGSRRCRGASMGNLSRMRRVLSSVGTWLSQMPQATKISDPLSGFFMIKRSLFEDIKPVVARRGFKTLVNILTVLPVSVRLKEISYCFKKREHGHSKVNVSLAVQCAYDMAFLAAVRHRRG